MAKIEYENKEKLQDKPEIANKNKVTAEDLNEIKNVVNENDNMFSEFKNNITNIVGDTGLKKLWENPNPTNDMGIIDINLSSSDYDYIVLIYRALGFTNIQKSEIILKGGSTNLIFIQNYATGNIWGSIEGLNRYIDYVDDTTYKTRNCESLKPGTATTTANGACIPVVMYGGKF